MTQIHSNINFLHRKGLLVPNMQIKVYNSGLKVGEIEKLKSPKRYFLHFFKAKFNPLFITSR